MFSDVNESQLRNSPGFRKAIHVIVKHGSQKLLPITAGKIMIVEFFVNGTVKDAQLSLPKPSYASLQEARTAPGIPR